MTVLAISAICIAFFVPLILGALSLKYSRLFSMSHRKRVDHRSIQASHRGKPLRIGGLLIIIGCFLSAAVISGQSSGQFILLVLLSSLTVFIAGFLEDLGYFVKPLIRLIAAFLSSGAAIYLTGFMLERVDILYIDALFEYSLIAAILTVLFAGIYCHSLNIIDGLNGLAVQVIICSAIGLTVIGFQIDFKQLAAFCLIMTFATIGFGFYNWPHARLFLGDAGAYGIGHILVWVGISYLSSNEVIAFPAILLVLFWPIADMVHTVARRILMRKSIFRPDNQHTHQKVKRLAEKMLSRRIARRYSNPVASTFLFPMIALPPLVGVLLYENAQYAWIALSLFFSFFCINYYLLGKYEQIFKRD